MFPNDPYFRAYTILEVIQSAQTGTPWTYLRFDLSRSNAIPPGSVITSAEAQLYLSSFSVPATNKWVAWNVTTLVQEWRSGTRTNQGLVLLPGSTNVMNLFFPSREDLTRPPRLVISFTPP